MDNYNTGRPTPQIPQYFWPRGVCQIQFILVCADDKFIKIFRPRLMTAFPTLLSIASNLSYFFDKIMITKQNEAHLYQVGPQLCLISISALGKTHEKHKTRAWMTCQLFRPFNNTQRVIFFITNQ